PSGGDSNVSLEEGLKAVVPLYSIDEIQDKNHDKLVHLSGKLQTDMVLNDGEYGVAVKAVKLKRNVEMFQWVEHKSTKYLLKSYRVIYMSSIPYRENPRRTARRGFIRNPTVITVTALPEYNEGDKTRVETSYSYDKQWKSSIVSSHQFDNPSGHQNPSSMPVSPYVKEADPVNVGAFKISKGLIRKIDEFQRLVAREIPTGKNIILQDGSFYHSNNPFNPQVGDVRVSFSYAGLSGKSGSALGEPLTVSIVARQHGKTLTHYHTESGHSLELLYPGELSAKEIFDAEHAANTALTWILRGVGWIMLFLGFMLMTSILTTL
ncbi:hypothetical protein QZH41_016200, partial [Actinostola sp. cb2023]